MGYLDYAGLQYLWGKLKEKFAPKSHDHDDRYYTESEMNTKLSKKAENIVLASDTNLNNITTPGFYSCGGANSITNKPSGTDAIGLIVTHNAGGAYYTQILTTSSNSNTYRRTCLKGTWSKWTQDKYTDTNTWRGIQDNLTSDSKTDSLSAAQGKALKTLVDGKAPNGHKHTKDQVGLSNVDNTADKDKTVASAAKLTTARTVSGGSDITLSFNYDGSGNSTANIGFYSCKHIVGNTNNYPFHRFARLDANKGAWVDNSMTILINQDYSGGGYGICRLVYRSNADSGNASVVAEWLVRKGLSADTVQVAIKTDKTNGAYCDAFYKSSGTYMSVVIRAIASGSGANSGRTWTLISSNEVSGTTTTDKKTSSECWKTIADAGNELHKQAYSASAPAIDKGYVASAGSANTAASCAGNSASATKLTSSAGSATQPVYFKDGKPVAGTYTLGDASSKMVRTLGSVGNTGWANKTTDDKYVPTMSFMAYWNGAYSSSGASNLQYCDRGRFGTIVTKNSGDYASAGHTHGLNSSSLAMTVSNTTTDSWDMVGGNGNGEYVLRSLRMQANAPAWLRDNYAAGIVFGGQDTRGVISHAYGSPAVKFAGGNGKKPVWYFQLTGTTGKSYNLDSMPYASSADSSNGVKDYNDANRTIKIGYAGAGLTKDNLSHIAGYTDNGTKIKDVNKDVLKSWIGLENYLPLSGGTMSGQITKSTGGSWIGDRDRATVKSGYAGDWAYGAVAAMATKNGYWTMGNLGGNESLIFNYSTDSNYNAGNNSTSQVYLPAQAGTIITSATIGSQTVASAGNATTWAGLSLRQNHNTSDTWIPVFSNNAVDYILKSEIVPDWSNGASKANSISAYGFYGASGASSWYHLCNITTNGDSSNTIISVLTGNGYNGGSSQNDYFQIILKDGWQSSASASSAIGVLVLHYPSGSENTSLKVMVRCTAANKCSVYLFLPWDYWNGNYWVSGNYSSWENVASKLSAEPTTGTAQDVRYEWITTQDRISYVKDSNDGGATTFAYSKAGMSYGDYTWLAAWNGKELRAVNKSQFATASAGVTASGSNYVRFGNGTQICWGYKNEGDRGGTTSFAVAFNNTSYALALTATTASNNAPFITRCSTTSFSYERHGTSYDDVQWIAVGTWK